MKPIKQTLTTCISALDRLRNETEDQDHRGRIGDVSSTLLDVLLHYQAEHKQRTALIKLVRDLARAVNEEVVAAGDLDHPTIAEHARLRALAEKFLKGVDEKQ